MKTRRVLLVVTGVLVTLVLLYFLPFSYLQEAFSLLMNNQEGSFVDAMLLIVKASVMFLIIFAGVLSFVSWLRSSTEKREDPSR